MNLKYAAIAMTFGAVLTGSAFAQNAAPSIPHLDHVFVIMMENHQYIQILNNKNAPFITSYAKSANLATKYFAVGHPSLTNYLEVVGGSNFGILNDDSPDWHNLTCTPNIVSGIVANEATPTNTCPISGQGYDAPTPAVDTTNEGTPQEPIYNYPLAPAWTVGQTIADQLVGAGMSWKAYEENLPAATGADGVNNSDGLVSNLTQAEPDMPKLYAVKHNPFVYFANLQAGTSTQNSFANITGFDQLFYDLKAGNISNYSYIVPNQCHDQHERPTTEVGTGCNDDQLDIAQGDAALSVIINGIKTSPAWSKGNNAIVTIWDENDYSSLPNRVIAIVDTNYGSKGVESGITYNHFSLLKSIEAGFGLPYLNHAADKNIKLMTDLFN